MLLQHCAERRGVGYGLLSGTKALEGPNSTETLGCSIENPGCLTTNWRLNMKQQGSDGAVHARITQA
jgi:hypothetical protein